MKRKAKSFVVEYGKLSHRPKVRDFNMRTATEKKNTTPCTNKDGSPRTRYVSSVYGWGN